MDFLGSSATSDAVHDLFFKINEEHDTTIVVVTHNPGFAESMPRVVRMKDGSVESDGAGHSPRRSRAQATETA